MARNRKAVMKEATPITPEMNDALALWGLIMLTSDKVLSCATIIESSERGIDVIIQLISSKLYIQICIALLLNHI